MYLREFDLDMPYVAEEARINSIMQERQCSRNDATKFDYESYWKDKRRMFRLETRCMTAMFERLFEKMKTEDCWKILIECVETINSESIKNLSGVYCVQVKLEHNRFTSSDDLAKKQMTLDMLMQGIRIIAREKDWSVEPFETVCLKMRERDLENDWIWKKPIKSPNKKYIAELLCRHMVKTIDIYIVLKDKTGNEILREKIISELPDEFVYTKLLGELKWISENEVVLVNKKGDNRWSVKLGDEGTGTLSNQ